MDSHLAAVLKRSRASLLDKTHFPEGEDQAASVKPLTLTETQVQPIDLSLKSPCAYFRPQDHKQGVPCDYEKKLSRLGKKRGQRCVLHGGEDKTDVEVASREASLCDSLSSEEGFMAVCSVNLNDSADSLVDVKEEIQEVCIGELDEYREDYSSTPVFLHEKRTAGKDSRANTANGIKVNRERVAKEAIATTTADPKGIVTDSLGILAKDTAEQQASAVDKQKLDSNVNDKHPDKTVTGLSSGIPQKSKSCLVGGDPTIKGISAESGDQVEEGCAKFGKQEADSSATPARSGKGPYGREPKLDNETNADIKGNSKGVKWKVEDGEALNLSLSKKSRKRGACRNDQLLEEEMLEERKLVIKMDVNKELEKNAFSLGKEESANVSRRESNPSPTSPVPLPHSPASVPEDCDAAGLLLIDDQGIPYILTPDGEKVLQVAPPKSCKCSTASFPRQRVKQAEVKDSPDELYDGELPKKDSTQAPPSVSKEVSLCSNSDELLESPETVTPLRTTSNQDTAVISAPSNSSSQPNLATHPVQTLGNLTSNVVLVRSSHFPNPSTTKPKSSSNLLALSLPVSLNQSPPSAPLLLVLSPVKAAPNPPPFSASTLSVTEPTPSSLVPSKTQSHSPTSTVSSSSPTSSPSPADCTDPTTSISGNTNCCQPVPNSPTTSVSHYDKTVKPDIASKKVFHKRSRRRDVLKHDDSSQSVSPSVENQAKSTSPVTASGCPDEPHKSTSPLSTLNPSLHPSSTDSPALGPQSVPTSDTHEGSFAPDESHYPVCGTPPSTAIFPSNHPKNFTLSSTCPRRILYCQFCPRAFYYLSDLERHSITHSQSKPHVCPLCSKAFKRSSHLERHKHIHTGQRNFICPICSKRFREAGELLRHQRVHTGEKPFQCPLCHMRFAERNTLRRHTKRKHQETSGQADTHGMQGSQGESAEWYSCAVPDSDSDADQGKE